MSATRRKYFLFSLFALVALVFDLWTKTWARAALGPTEGTGRVKQVFGDTLYFRYAENPGVAFSMFRDLAGGRYILTTVAAAALVMVILYLRKLEPDQTRLHIALGLVGGGAIGNLLDRIVYGVVTDFIIVDLGFWPFHPWPAFNIADAALVIGVGLMAIDFVRAPRPAVDDAPAAKPQKEPQG
jgi:signal peptidase II